MLVFQWVYSICLLLQPFGRFSCSTDNVALSIVVMEESQELHSFTFGLGMC